MFSGAWRGYARSHAPEGPRDALRLQLLVEGPRARVHREAHPGRVPGAVRRPDAPRGRHARAHPRCRAELASAPTGAARRGLEEGVATHRLPDGEGAHRPLAPRRVRDEGVAHHARRRAALADPRLQSRVDTDRAFSALVLPAAYPRTHAAADERRRRSVDADAAIAREHRLSGSRRPHPQATASGLTRVAGAKRATWRT